LLDSRMIQSWSAHVGLSVLVALLLWAAVAVVQRRRPTMTEAVLCSLVPIAWYWSRESTQYERIRRFHAGYVERLLPWNWSADQLGDLLSPVLALALLLVVYAAVFARKR